MNISAKNQTQVPALQTKNAQPATDAAAPVQKPRHKLVPIRFGEFLVEKRILEEGQLLDALAGHWSSGDRIGDVVVERGFASRNAVERCAIEYHGGLPVVEIEA